MEFICVLMGLMKKFSLSLSLSLSFSVISINFICFISFGLCVALTTQKEMKYYKSENYRFCFKRKTQLA